MGLSRGDTKVLLKEASQRPFKGRVLTLGRQDIWFSYDLLQEMAMEFDVELSNPGNITFSHKRRLAIKRYISDDCLFKSLGFSESKALDISGYESAHYIFDLNNTDVPKQLLEAFDVIVNGGTIEHIFHIPNVLDNIYKMLRQGGRIIHMCPSSNFIDHGFYMFSPIFLWDFYKANKFEINNFQIFRHTPQHETDPWEISDYQPGCLNRVSYGGLDDGMYGIICIATKTKDSTGHVVPQQSNIYETNNRPNHRSPKGLGLKVIAYY